MMKRIGSVLLAVLLVIFALPMLAVAEESSANTTEFAGGSGTEEDPYIITEKAHLNNVRNHVGAHFRMDADVEFSYADFAQDGEYYNDGAYFYPIGGNFTGVFDGNGYAIKNLKMSVKGSSLASAGLIRCLDGGTVKNLHLRGGSIYAAATSSDSFVRAGSVVSYVYNEGNIINCTNSCSVTASGYESVSAGGIVSSAAEVIGCTNTGSVTTAIRSGSSKATSYTGGIAGSAYVITDCVNTGTVEAKKSATLHSATVYLGGLVGQINSGYYTTKGSDNRGRVFSNFFDGPVNNITLYMGGIAGKIPSETVLDDCHNTGSMLGDGGSVNGLVLAYVGGIAGYAGDLENVNGIIQNCTNRNYITAETTSAQKSLAYVGGVVGVGYLSIKDCHNKAEINLTTKAGDGYAGGIEGYAYRGDIQNCSNTGSVYTGTTGTSKLYTSAYSGGISGSGRNVVSCHNTGGVTARSTNTARAGGIMGVGDSITSAYNMGNVWATSSNGSARAGGIKGSGGSISLCYNVGNVKVEASTRNNDATGYVGGITGGGSDIANCYNRGALSVSATGYSGIKAYGYVGGIAGSGGNITSCYNVGTVTISATHGTNAGGIVGKVAAEELIADCYCLNTVYAGLVDTEPVTFCSEEQLKDQTTFENFDFDTVWTMAGNELYPYPELQNVGMKLPVASIQVEASPEKVVYKASEDALEVTGGTLTITYDTGSTKVVELTADMIIDFDPEKTEEQEVTVIVDNAALKVPMVIEQEMSYMLGDVDGNGNIAAADALLALQIATGKVTPTEPQALSANVDGKESVAANDALLILQLATQKITAFPAATA